MEMHRCVIVVPAAWFYVYGQRLWVVMGMLLCLVIFQSYTVYYSVQDVGRRKMG
jgi:hypothetical protein